MKTLETADKIQLDILYDNLAANYIRTTNASSTMKQLLYCKPVGTYLNSMAKAGFNTLINLAMLHIGNIAVIFDSDTASYKFLDLTSEIKKELYKRIYFTGVCFNRLKSRSSFSAMALANVVARKRDTRKVDVESNDDSLYVAIGKWVTTERNGNVNTSTFEEDFHVYLDVNEKVSACTILDSLCYPNLEKTNEMDEDIYNMVTLLEIGLQDRNLLTDGVAYLERILNSDSVTS